MLEIDLQEAGLKTRTITLLCCTSDQCHNATQRHKAEKDGWWTCIKCGMRRQDVRHRASGRHPKIDK